MTLGLRDCPSSQIVLALRIVAAIYCPNRFRSLISLAKSDELFDLVNYRNLIGHNIHELTVDVGAYLDLPRLAPKTYDPLPAYDYYRGKRAQTLRLKIMNGMRIAEMNRVIAPIPESVKATARPNHPRNIQENDSLTMEGRRGVVHLFEAKANSCPPV